jgi:hypothetical protein
MCCCALKFVLGIVFLSILIAVAILVTLFFVKKGDNCYLLTNNCCWEREDWTGCHKELPLTWKNDQSKRLDPNLDWEGNLAGKNYCGADFQKLYKDIQKDANTNMCWKGDKKEFRETCLKKCGLAAEGKEVTYVLGQKNGFGGHLLPSIVSGGAKTAEVAEDVAGKTQEVAEDGVEGTKKVVEDLTT